MAALRVPGEDQAAIVALVSLPDEQLEALIRSIENLSPSISVSNFAERAADRAGIDAAIAQDLIALAANLYRLWDAEQQDDPNATLPEFVESICQAASQTANAELKRPEHLAALKTRLTRLLALDASLGLTAKALGIFMENDKLVCRSRVTSDLRPIFPIDRSKLKVEAAVVVHTLRITYHHGNDLDHVFVTLQRHDLEQLQRQIDRAIKKEDSLRTVATKAELTCLNLEEE